MGFGRTIIGVAAFGKKGTSPDNVTLNSEEIKPLAIASIELCLSEEALVRE